jgi:hypothetical protein
MGHKLIGGVVQACAMLFIKHLGFNPNLFPTHVVPSSRLMNTAKSFLKILTV